MKRFVLLFFALAGFISSAAGQEQEITGFVYVSETSCGIVRHTAMSARHLSV